MASSSVKASNAIKNFLKSNFKLISNFKLKDLGILIYFLGLEIARTHKRISICQRKYTLNLLTKYGFLGSKLISALIDYCHKLSNEDGDDQLKYANVYR